MDIDHGFFSDSVPFFMLHEFLPSNSSCFVAIFGDEIVETVWDLSFGHNPEIFFYIICEMGDDKKDNGTSANLCIGPLGNKSLWFCF